MDPDRVRAYLQVACAGLGFDIGEIWWTNNENGASTVAAIEEQPTTGSSKNTETNKKFRFVQLYTSKSYENRRCELVNPPENSNENPEQEGSAGDGDGMKRENDSDNLEKHVLSPRLVDSIARTTQVVWANSKRQEGLIGRSDIRLQTAVGMPVAVDGNGNMCVVVMFSPNNINSTDDAMEYLQSISLSATSSTIPCLLPVLDPTASGLKRLTHPDVQQQQQQYGSGGGNHRGGSGSSVQTDANALGEGVVARFVSLDSEFGDPHVQQRRELTNAPKDTFGIPMLPAAAEIGNVTPDENFEAFDEASYGVWSTIMDPLLDEIAPIDAKIVDDPRSSASSGENLCLPGQVLAAGNYQRHKPMSLDRKVRLEEFCLAFLGMSVFDIADVWVPAGNDAPDCLRHITSVTTSSGSSLIKEFMHESENTYIKHWNGAVGRAFSSGNPVWSANRSFFMDPGRAVAFDKACIMTVLAVPVFSSKETLPACVVSCYALVSSGSVPFVLKFVQQALRLLWDGLDNVRPHESVGKNMWQDVAPADLGEMAADVEMQQHFLKKRPHSLISAVEQIAPTPDPETSRLADHLQSVVLPNGETVTVPLKMSDTATSVPTVNLEHIQNHVQEAIRSVATAVPFDRVSTNAQGTKRAHVMGFVQDHRPLPMPQSFPTVIVGATHPASAAPQNEPARYETMILAPPQAPEVSASTQQPQHTSYAPMHQIEPMLLYEHRDMSSAQQIPAPGQVASNQFCLPVIAPHGQVQFRESNSSKICRIQGCDDFSVDKRPYCAKHSGNRQCEHPTCSKGSQGSTRFCIAHGGGRRCKHPGCDKGARDKHHCAAHGGGKRCKLEGCSKSAVGGSNLCTAHGGGRRCAIDGCDKSAQSSTKFCVKHGGGKKCSHESCTKVARGRTQFCAAHGGGVRCKLNGCNRVAIGKLQLCRAHGGGAASKSDKLPSSPTCGGLR